MIVEKIVNTTVFDELEIIGVTLLSAEEAERLPLRLCRYGNWWWLRSHGVDNDIAALALNTGEIYHFGYAVDCDDISVRPALKIKLESSNKIGDCFIFGNKEFEIISTDTAFCKTDIGEHCFRADWAAKGANVYEESGIKKYVDEWFEENKND